MCAKQLSHTAVYFLSRMNDPNIPPDLHAWGRALSGAELRCIPKKDRIGEIRRNQYIKGIHSQLFLYLNNHVEPSMFF